MISWRVLAIVLTTFPVLACRNEPAPLPDGPSDPSQPVAAAAAAPDAEPSPEVLAATGRPPTEEAVVPLAPSPYDALPEPSRALLDRAFTGDLDEMIDRRLIRAGVVFNRTQYFIDYGVQRGISYEAITLFEKELNARLKTGRLPIHVAIIPMQRDELFPALQAGKIDFVAAALTITPERMKVADFSTPTRVPANEIVVAAPGVTPPLTTFDLSGRDVFVRRSSSYYESLLALNETLAQHGMPPVTITAAPEALEDDDILEMANAGLVPMTVVDDFAAEFWRRTFTRLQVLEHVILRANGTIAVGIRKGNPQLRSAINDWIRKYGPRSAFGNIMQGRYLENTKYVREASIAGERERLNRLIRFFQVYGDRYNVDYLLVAAQGYQESGLDQSMKSRVGAIGVMQVMPATGRELNVGDITSIEPNIHAGVKYFRFMMDQYFANEPMDNLNKGLMTLASYNAGPARIRQMRAEAARRGLNPNVWFGNVERVVSERVGRETVQYVGNIYKYYVAYRLLLERRDARERARGAP